MAGASSPTIRSRNAKYQSKGTLGRRGSSSSSAAERRTKPAINPYLVGFLLLMMSGGAIFQVLRLFGVKAMVDDD
ncbi:hypothetical protein B0O80DRAFT_498706 [Mortierella sp. GBAus27b]|nr:hypothetical protein B0O80DRAFT_498706 [Mortierella sp. GBAus27b]